MIRNILSLLLIAFSITSSFIHADSPAPTTDEWTIEQSDVQVDGETAQPASTPEFQGAFFKMIFMLVGIIALVILTFIIFRRLMHTRMMSANQNNVIKIVEKRTLSPKSMLYLVQIGEDRVLVAESHLEVRALHFLEKEE